MFICFLVLLEETASLKSAKKRGCEESDGMDFAGEMQKMLDCFGSM